MAISLALLVHENKHDNYETLGEASKAFFKAHVADFAITVTLIVIGILGVQSVLAMSPAVSYILVGAGMTSLVINTLVCQAVSGVIEICYEYEPKKLRTRLTWVRERWWGPESQRLKILNWLDMMRLNVNKRDINALD